MASIFGLFKKINSFICFNFLLKLLSKSCRDFYLQSSIVFLMLISIANFRLFLAKINTIQWMILCLKHINCARFTRIHFWWTETEYKNDRSTFSFENFWFFILDLKHLYYVINTLSLWQKNYLSISLFGK